MIITAISTLVLELCEEGLEELIALGVSLIAIKILSTFAIVGITQGIKFTIKKTAKLLFYKKGVDKMEKLKTIFAKLVEYFKTNPITIGTSVANIAGSSGVGYAVYTLFCDLGVCLPSWALYLVVAVVSVLVACLVEWGILKQGWETNAAKALRLASVAAQKEAARIEAEAAAALKAQEEEAARLEAEAQALIEAEKKAEEDARAEAEAAIKKAEHDALVAAKLAELRAKQPIKETIEE